MPELSQPGWAALPPAALLPDGGSTPLTRNFVFLSRRYSNRNKCPQNNRKSNKSHMCLHAPAKTVIKSLLFLEKQGACQPRGEEAVNPRRGGFLGARSAEPLP